MKKILYSSLIIFGVISTVNLNAYSTLNNSIGNKSFIDYEILSYKGDFIKNKDNVSLSLSGYIAQPFKINKNEGASLPNNFIIKDYTLFTSLFEQNGIYSISDIVSDLKDENSTTLQDGYVSPKPIGLFFKNQNLAKNVGITPEKYKTDVEKGLSIFLSKSLYDSLKNLDNDTLSSLFLSYGDGSNNTLGVTLKGSFKTITGSDTFDLCKAENSENEYSCNDILNNLKNEYLKGNISDEDFKKSFTSIYDTKDEQKRSINIKVFVADSITIKDASSKITTIINTTTASKYSQTTPQFSKENLQDLKKRITGYKSKLDSNGLTELNSMLLKINNYIKLGDSNSIEKLLQDYSEQVKTLEGKLKEITKGKSNSDVDYLAQTDKTFANSRLEYKNKLYTNMIIKSYYEYAGSNLINKVRIEKLKSLLNELKNNYSGTELTSEDLKELLGFDIFKELEENNNSKQ